MRSVFYKAIAGLLGGGLAWLLMEPMAPTSLSASASLQFEAWEKLFTLVLFAFIALALGIASGLQKGSWMHVLKEGGLGLVFGTIGGLLGQSLGGSLAVAMFPNVDPAAVHNLEIIPWRILALGLIGPFLGAGIGFASLSFSRAIQGAIGGLIGGLIAAGSFDIIGKMVGAVILAARQTQSGEIGGPSRAAFAILLGLGIGLFIGIAERVMTSAYLRLVLARNEGREWAIDRNVFVIGRGELVDAPITGDPSIMPQHAIISRENGQYFIADNNTPTGTYVDGNRIMKVPIGHGTWIGVGKAKLQFLLKKAAPVPVYAGPNPGEHPINQGYGPGPNQAAMGQTMMSPFQAQGQPGGPTQMYPPQGGQPYPGQPTMQTPSMGSQPTMQSPFQGAPSQPTQAMGQAMFKVVILDGPQIGSSYSVGSAIEVGRDGAGIRLASDSQASRRHASLSPAGLGVAVTDLGSTNGTFINGQRVQNGMASSGDLIKIGSTTFRVDRA